MPQDLDHILEQGGSASPTYLMSLLLSKILSVQVTGRTVADLLHSISEAGEVGATALLQLTAYVAGNYDALADMDWHDGTLYVVFRRGTAHTGTDGVIMLITIDQFGTVSTPTQIASDPTYDLRDPHIKALTTGELILSVFRHNGASAIDVQTMVSTDGFATRATVTLASSTYDGWLAESSKVYEDRGGDLYLPMYAQRAADTHSSVILQRSTDRGATWGSEQTIMDGASAGFSYQEPVMGYAPNDGGLGQWIMVARTSAGDAYYSHSNAPSGSWAAPADSGVQMAQGIDLAPMSDGSLAMSYRRANQGTFAKRITYDNGSWTFEEGIVEIDRSQKGGYPGAVEVAPGVLAFVVYADSPGGVAPSVIRFGFFRLRPETDQAKIYGRGGALASSATETLFDIQRACVVESVVWNQQVFVADLRLLLQVRKPDGTYYTHGMMIVTAAPQSAGLYMSGLNEWGDDLFEVVNYDTSNNRYVARLVRPLECPYGAKLSVANTNAASQNIGVQATVRLLAR